MISKKIILPALAITALVGGLTLTTSLAKADETGTGPQSLITRIAQKFNLKESDVKQVFDDEHAARQAEHKTEVTARLDAAVKDGKITDSQKTAILNKLTEMEANRPDMSAMKDKTWEERKADRDTRRADLEKWASDNGLSLETLKEYIGFGGHGRGMGHGMM